MRIGYWLVNEKKYTNFIKISIGKNENKISCRVHIEHRCLSILIRRKQNTAFTQAFNCVLGANIVGSIIENKKKHFSSNAIENLIFGSDLPPAQKHYLRGFSELVAKNDVTKIEPFIVINSYYADCMK